MGSWLNNQVWVTKTRFVIMIMNSKVDVIFNLSFLITYFHCLQIIVTIIKIDYNESSQMNTIVIQQYIRLLYKSP